MARHALQTSRLAALSVGTVLVLVQGCADASPASSTDATVTDAASDTGADIPFEDPLTPLVDHTQWQQLDAAADPFPGHRPTELECSEAGIYNEDGYLEIDTGSCNYVSVSQLTLADVVPGETLEASLWYGPLIAEGAFEAHAAIVLDGEVVWERQIPIPNPGGLAVATFAPERSYPAGTPIVFHLHNHGLNTWTLVYIGKF